jgi:glycosyltransferase involved in cell wall biosynthesis
MLTRKVICLTPVKNEAWILDLFIQCTSLWADYIIIADQGSTDGSVEIAKKYDKVILISNNGNQYNETERQKLLLIEARKIEGDNNVFMTLDADELLANYENNPEWKNLCSAEPGTTFWLPWLNVLPDIKTYFSSNGGNMLFGYINDGKEHKGNVIHSPRVPSDLNEERLFCNTLKVLHFQYAFRNRLLSKHRWYECLEKIKFPIKNNIDIYRQYHHIDLVTRNIEPIDKQWLVSMERNKINICDLKDNEQYWWDKEVCIFFDTYGVKKFQKIAIWYVDWNKIYKHHFSDKSDALIHDPRNIFDKWIHIWLSESQVNRFGFWNKVFNKLLRIINW